MTRAEIQALRELRRPESRRAAGCWVAEGTKAVAEILATRPAGVRVWATPEWPGLAAARAIGVAVEVVGSDEMQRISHFPTPSPVLAVVPWREHTDQPEAARAGLTLALDEVQDPGNVGTLIRTADWLGVDRIWCSPGCADAYGAKVVSATMGSLLRVPVSRVRLAPHLEAAAVPVCAADGAGEPVAQFTWPGLPLVLVVGNEGHGLSPELRGAIRHRVAVPRRGGGESLNAAIAGAILLERAVAALRG